MQRDLGKDIQGREANSVTVFTLHTTMKNLQGLVWNTDFTVLKIIKKI